MTLLRIYLAAALLSSAVPSLRADGGPASDIWSRANPFNKSLADGKLHAPLVDPLYPPQIDLWMLSLTFKRLIATADYYNLQTQPLTVEGRRVDLELSPSDFYPYADLQVSNELRGPWQTIGQSPAAEIGTPVSVLMQPNAPKTHKFPHNMFCTFDFDPFRLWLDRAEYGRVVLRGGETSQVIALVDLLPPPGKLIGEANDEGKKKRIWDEMKTQEGKPWSIIPLGDLPLSYLTKPSARACLVQSLLP